MAEVVTNKGDKLLTDKLFSQSIRDGQPGFDCSSASGFHPSKERDRTGPGRAMKLTTYLCLITVSGISEAFISTFRIPLNGMVLRRRDCLSTLRTCFLTIT